MSSPILATFSSPTAEITPRKRVVRGFAASLARRLNGVSPLLTGLLKSRLKARKPAAGDWPQACCGGAPLTWKIVLLLCHSVQRGAPKLVSVIRNAGRFWLLVGQLTARNICQALRSNSRCTCGNWPAFSSLVLSVMSTSPGNCGVRIGAKFGKVARYAGTAGGAPNATVSARVAMAAIVLAAVTTSRRGRRSLKRYLMGDSPTACAVASGQVVNMGWQSEGE